MSHRWTVHLQRADLESLKSLRLVRGAEVCETSDGIWVRGPQLDEATAILLRKHPRARRFWVLPDNQLLQPDRRVPLGHLPAGPWSPLCDWLTVALPSAAFAGQVDTHIALNLRRSDHCRPTNVLLTTIDRWARYGAGAPQIRLNRWCFAAAADGRVVVRGVPVAPLPGTPYVEQAGVAVPAGWAIAPELPEKVLSKVLQVEPGGLVLLDPNGSLQRIAASDFVRATRSAIRATQREFVDG